MMDETVLSNYLINNFFWFFYLKLVIFCYHTIFSHCMGYNYNVITRVNLSNFSNCVMDVNLNKKTINR